VFAPNAWTAAEDCQTGSQGKRVRHLGLDSEDWQALAATHWTLVTYQAPAPRYHHGSLLCECDVIIVADAGVCRPNDLSSSPSLHSTEIMSMIDISL